MAGLRVPFYELWGLLVKACLLVLLGALGYLLVRGPGTAALRTQTGS
jgi:hypothetical protein